MANFWNAVLTVNSILLTGAAIFLVYSFGMMVIALEWKRFLVAVATFVVLVATELAIATVLHN